MCSFCNAQIRYVNSYILDKFAITAMKQESSFERKNYIFKLQLTHFRVCYGILSVYHDKNKTKHAVVQIFLLCTHNEVKLQPSKKLFINELCKT